MTLLPMNNDNPIKYCPSCGTYVLALKETIVINYCPSCGCNLRIVREALIFARDNAPTTDKRVPLGRRKPTPPGVIKRIHELTAEGKTGKAVAKALGISYSSVHKYKHLKAAA